MRAEDLTPRRTLAEVIEIARDLALCADAADQEAISVMGGGFAASGRAANARVALLWELVDAHRAGQLDAIVAILTAHRARMLRQVAEGIFDLVAQRGAAIARVTVQPHFTGDLSEAGIGDLDDLALGALDRAINDALAGVV